MEVEAVVDMLDQVLWMERANPAAMCEVAAHDEMMYCQKVSLVHSP